MSAAVMTARTPGCFSAADVSIERMRPCATELRRIAACSAPAARHVVDELPAAAQEAQVLQAFDRAADGAIDVRGSMCATSMRAQLKTRTAYTSPAMT